MLSVTSRNRIFEVLAVVFNLLYTVLYIRGNVWCYLFGVLGPLMFVFLCYWKKLYAEPVLQLFYIGFAVYGYFNLSAEWTTIHVPWTYHLPYITAGIVISAVAGYFLRKKTDAKFPYADSAVTVFGIIGTWLMVNYIHENWIYFIIINAVCIVIYTMRRLYLGALMFILYLLMSLDGYFFLGIFSS